MLERTFPAQFPRWLYPARLSSAWPQPSQASLFQPGSSAPDGFYASTPSSGRTPQYGTDDAGHPTSQLPEDTQPGWLVGPGDTVHLDVASVRTQQLLAQNVIELVPDQSTPDNTSPANSVGGVAGFALATSQHPEVL